MPVLAAQDVGQRGDGILRQIAALALRHGRKGRVAFQVVFDRGPNVTEDFPISASRSTA